MFAIYLLYMFAIYIIRMKIKYIRFIAINKKPVKMSQ